MDLKGQGDSVPQLMCGLRASHATILLLISLRDAMHRHALASLSTVLLVLVGSCSVEHEDRSPRPKNNAGASFIDDGQREVSLMGDDVAVAADEKDVGDGGGAWVDEASEGGWGGIVEQEPDEDFEREPAQPTNDFPSPRQIARMLMEPKKKHHLIVLGDSRNSTKQTFALTYCVEVAWSGALTEYVNALDATNGAHDSTGIAATINETVNSPWLGGKAIWMPLGSGVETKFAGIPEPGSGDNNVIMRVYSSPPRLSKERTPLLWKAFEAGGEVLHRVIYYRHAQAPSASPGLSISHRARGSNFSDPGNLQGEYVYDMTGAGYGTIELVLPDGYDWTTYDAPNLEMVAKPLAVTVADEIAIVSTPWLEKNGPGIVYFPLARGGWSVDGWVDERIIPNSLFDDFLPLVAQEPIFWLDLGTNNPAKNSQIQHVEKMIRLIERVRSVWPYAPILLTSAFASSLSGSDPYYRAAAAALAEEVHGLLYLDTYGAMPDYPSGQNLGYYSDEVHYNDLGNAAFFTMVGQLIFRARTRGDY